MTHFPVNSKTFIRSDSVARADVMNARHPETNKRTAGLFLDTLCDLAYKGTKKNGELSCPVLANW
jgi:hypothetical protein